MPLTTTGAGIGSSSGGGGTANTWNPADQVNAALSNGNLTATQAAGNWGVRASVPAAAKYYFEAKVTGTPTGGAGIASSAANLSTVYANVLLASYVLYSSGSIYYNSGTQVATLGSAFVVNDVACIAVDMTNKRIWYRKNGGNWNSASAGNDPATNVGGIDISSVFASVPALPLATSPGAAIITANFGSTAFAFASPAGFSNANL
jgi:hypothetical protein